jgi:hypothetical protein
MAISDEAFNPSRIHHNLANAKSALVPVRRILKLQ